MKGGTLPPDDNNIPVQVGNSIQTYDATGTPNKSPKALADVSNLEIVVPDRAAEIAIKCASSLKLGRTAADVGGIMSEMQYDRGSAIVIEVEFKKYTAFGVYEYFDPSTPTITVTDVEGTNKVDAAALIKQETGKYYYVVPTATDWITGRYETQISSSDTGNNDITIDDRSFFLK